MPAITRRSSTSYPVSILLAGIFAFQLAGIHAAELYFPPEDGEWETVTPAAVGWNAELLSQALDLAGERDSSGVVILHNGRIMGERYFSSPDNAVYQNYLQGYDARGAAIEDVASAQKSVIAVLTGMAQERGFLSIEDPVSDYLGEGWSNASAAQEKAITVEHLLSMSSGLDTEFGYVAEPDTEWLYNTPVYHSLARVLMAATGLERNELTINWISRPLGMTNTSWTPRPWAAAAIAVGLSTTARDLSRFGLMIQAGGKWGEQVILGDTEYLHDMLDSSQAMNPAYGYLWWLNGKEFVRNDGSSGVLIESAPDDLIAMQGAADRKLYLVPSLGLVITRLGYAGGLPGSSFNDAFWEALIRAAPE